MTRADLERRLNELLTTGRPHDAWALVISILDEEGGDASLKRALKYRTLRGCLVDRLPRSFWDDSHMREAARHGVEVPSRGAVVGQMAFPVVFTDRARACFVAASVRRIDERAAGDAVEDELPDDSVLTGRARRAVAEALIAARRLVGVEARFRVILDKGFPEPIDGPSCGLAVALATLSAIENEPIGDDIMATGEVTREGAVRHVDDLPAKMALRRAARPIGRLLHPAGLPVQDALAVAVATLDDARRDLWRPDPDAVERALDEFRQRCVDDPHVARLDLRALTRRGHETRALELKLLEIAVAPLLTDEQWERNEERAAALRRKLRARDLPAGEKQQIEVELHRLEQARWEPPSGFGPRGTLSFASALGRFRRFTVIGDPGAGKSVLMRLAVLACAGGEIGARASALLGRRGWGDPHAQRAMDELGEALPLRLALGAWGKAVAADPDLSLTDFARRRLRAQGASRVLLEGFDGLLAAGRVLLLCDGLDEVREDRRRQVVDAIAAFLRRYPSVRLVLTSRPQVSPAIIPDLAPTRLSPLHHRQRHALIARLHRCLVAGTGSETEQVVQARIRTNALLHGIDRGRWKNLDGNPLLLTLLALTPPDDDGAPKHRVYVFEYFVRTIVAEWRSAPDAPLDPEGVIAAWSAVAVEMLRLEQRHGLARSRVARILKAHFAARGGTRPDDDAAAALKLAIDTGLVTDDGESIAFWHSAFGEFLAARDLTGDGTDAAARLLAAPGLTLTTLQLAAARLAMPLDMPEEADALIDGLLARDETGAARLTRPGLRAAAQIVQDGVHFGPAVATRFWTKWIEILEREPPSQLWLDFAHLVERTPPERFPTALVTRLAAVDDRKVRDVADAIAQLVAPRAGTHPPVRAACERWLGHHEESLRKQGALGLAAAGTWSDDVINVLGRLDGVDRIPPETIAGVVRRGGAPLRERLRPLIRARLPSDEPQTTGRARRTVVNDPERAHEAHVRDLRAAAATLEALAGRFDDEIAEVLRLAVADSGVQWTETTKRAVRFAAFDAPAARETLLRWAEDGTSSAGSLAREVLRDVAPLIDGLTERVLERAAATDGDIRDKWEELLIEIGRELRLDVEPLGRWLDDERDERRLCAARILRRLSPRDERLHDAVRRGLALPDEARRVRWAELALVDDVLAQAGHGTLLACARSSDDAVRRFVYGSGILQHVLYEAGYKTSALPWVAIGMDPALAPAVRLDAALFVRRELEHEREEATFRALLDCADPAVRRAAAVEILNGQRPWHPFAQPEPDGRVYELVAETAARADTADHVLHLLRTGKPHAARILDALFRALPDEIPSERNQEFERRRIALIDLILELAPADHASVSILIGALDAAWLAQRLARHALDVQAEHHESIRAQIRDRLARGEAAPLGGLLTAIEIGLKHDDLRDAALAAFAKVDLTRLTPEGLDWLARRLRNVGVDDKAIALWLRVLDTDAPEIVLRAAKALVLLLTRDAGPLVERSLGRLLATERDPWWRLDAARLALTTGLHESAALDVVIECTATPDIAPRESPRDLFEHYLTEARLDDHLVDANSLQLLQKHPPRIDLEAMRILLGLRAAIGVQQLPAWLFDSDCERFFCAAQILGRRSQDRPRVQDALQRRLATTDIVEMRHTISIIDRMNLFTVEMANTLAERMASVDEREFRLLLHELTDWMRERPATWKIFEHADEGRRRVLRQTLFEQIPLTAEAVGIVVRLALDEQTREEWCQIAMDALELAVKGPGASVVRAAIGATLARIDVEEDRFGVWAFEQFARLADLPLAPRLERLRRALSVDPDSVAEERREDTFDHRTFAARSLLDLGVHDPEVLDAIAAAVNEYADSAPHSSIALARDLVKHRSPDAALRRAVLDVLLSAGWYYVRNEGILDLLEEFGVPRDQCLGLLEMRLIGDSPDSTDANLPEGIDPDRVRRLSNHVMFTEGLNILHELERLGCPPERRATLITRYVERHGDAIPTSVRLALAERPETPTGLAARLLLSIVACGDVGARNAAECWLKRFGRGDAKDIESIWGWDRDVFAYLPQRLRIINELGRIADPDLVEPLIIEMAGLTPELCALFRRARAGGPADEADWSTLSSAVSLTTTDSRETVFAKEWLALDLWRALAPETVKELLRS